MKSALKLPEAIHKDWLKNDPENRQGKYDQEKLEQLAASIRQHGIIQNLQAYRDVDESFIVVVGNRRLKATLLLLEKLETEIQDEVDVQEQKRLQQLQQQRSWLPVRILEGEEIETAKEQQLVENLQREDISAVDEALGYKWLSEKKNLSIREIAERVSKNASYVRNRMKLVLVPKKLLQALDKGSVGVRICEMVGRVPHKHDREELVDKILNPQWSDEPLDQDNVIRLIKEQYMCSLKSCGFDINDPELVPIEKKAGVRVMGGACKDCPYRTGNDETLSEDLASFSGSGSKTGVDPNVCTSPACFKAKQEEAWKIVVKSSEAKGDRVMSADSARSVFDARGQLSWNAKYEDLDNKPSHHVSGHFDDSKGKKWSALLKGVEIPIVMARNPETGRIHKLVDRKLAVEAVNQQANKQGLEPVFEQPKLNLPSEDDKHQKLQEKIARRAHLIALHRVLGNGTLQAVALYPYAMKNAFHDELWRSTKPVVTEFLKLFDTDSATKLDDFVGELEKRAQEDQGVYTMAYVSLLILRDLEYGQSKTEGVRAKAYELSNVDLEDCTLQATSELKPKKKGKAA